MNTIRRLISALLFAGYAGSVLAANWLITTYGIVDVVPGPASVMAPAGVYAVGAALVLRDLLHDLAGVWTVLAGIALGAALSAAVASPSLILASTVAFTVSELLDLGVYAPLRKRGWAVAALASSTVGLIGDSVLFLWLAFGSLTFLPGQVVGKAVAVVLAVGVGVLLRRAWSTGNVPLSAVT